MGLFLFAKSKLRDLLGRNTKPEPGEYIKVSKLRRWQTRKLGSWRDRKSLIELSPFLTVKGQVTK